MESFGFFEAELLGEIFLNGMDHDKPFISCSRNGPKLESSRRSSRIWQQMRIEQVLDLMDFEIAVTDDKGCLTGEFMPYGEYKKLTEKKRPTL